MEPVDDILIPPDAEKVGPSRLRTRHVLRALALLVIIAGVSYASMLYRQDAASTIASRQVDLLGVAPVVLFGIILWWYAGRKAGVVNQPLFRNATDGVSDVRLDRHNLVWVVVSLLAGFIGLASVTLGTTLMLRREALIAAYPFLREVNLSSGPFLIMGWALIILAALALTLALRRRSV